MIRDKLFVWAFACLFFPLEILIELYKERKAQVAFKTPAEAFISKNLGFYFPNREVCKYFSDITIQDFLMFSITSFKIIF